MHRATTPRGLELLRAEPNGFRVHLLGRSDTVSCESCAQAASKLSDAMFGLTVTMHIMSVGHTSEAQSAGLLVLVYVVSRHPSSSSDRDPQPPPNATTDATSPSRRTQHLRNPSPYPFHAQHPPTPRLSHPQRAPPHRHHFLRCFTRCASFQPFPRSFPSRPPSQSCVSPPRLRACFLLTYLPATLVHSHQHPTAQSLPSLYPQPNSFHSTHAQLSRATSTPSFPARFTLLRAPSSLTSAPPAPPPPPPPPSTRLRSVARLRFTRSAQRPTHPALAPLFRVGARVAREVG